MENFSFTDADLQQMEVLGITEAKVRAQVEIFHKSSYFVRLSRPCTLGDGVNAIPPEDTEEYLQFHHKAAGSGRFSKFVPASGAASRMFQSLLQIYHMPHYLDHRELQRRVERGVAVACDFLRFMEGLQQFPFLDDLEDVMARNGYDLGSSVEESQYQTILDYLLTERGLNYGSLPKGLLKFHRYSTGCRTAIEEHLVEGAHYVGNGNRQCSLHFTVSPEHESRFAQLLERVQPCYEKQYGTRYEVSFSCQSRSTDTIAVDMKHRPFRERFGRLLFRPGGHGALIENLNNLQGDLVYIKNVDNLTADRLKDTIALWKKVLGGYLVSIQEIIHTHLRRLQGEATEGVVEDAGRFAAEKLLIRFTDEYSAWPLDRKRHFLLSKLNRPIRVCGVVRNVGEPGGAPFWVKDRNGTLSVQIVEKAQVNCKSPEQNQIWMSSTHFNPVDIVCALRDFEGKPFDLRQFVDHEAVFITKKSKDGKELKALELPGLWNGAMADWITIIVEVPRITFNPVKTVYDLLRPEHQAEP